ncbi:MAG: hypothetical protein CML31_13110 [Rhizobiales bacterium]|nr:hypothetical protein [Hyphomicrobiales bacterium]|tara:strand:- start:262 stop:1347 length:1086 start_codon:yes stop_codon:yes gene_type:complete
MSTYRRPAADGTLAAEYSYDFRLGGRRYSGNTGATTKREADRIEQELKRQARARAKQGPIAEITIGEAFGRYWTEVGAFHKNEETTLVDFARLERWIGRDTRLCALTDADVASLIGQRRAEGVANATVNRSITMRLRAVFGRATKVWKAPPPDIDWPRHMLPEPQERIRELSADEEDALFAKLAPGYREIGRFPLLSGCRMAECLDLEWRHIDWRGGYLVVTGKGGKTRHITLHSELVALLKPLPRAHAKVFTHVLRRHSAAARKGDRVPIEREALKIHFRRMVASASIENFSFHDLRHTCATRLLRTSGNLRLVKDLLGHADLDTTLKYAHANHHDMRAALDATFGLREEATQGATEITT